MLRKRLLVLFIILLSAIAVTLPAQAAKNFKNLAFSGPYVERHPTYIRAWAPWFEKAKTETKGELSFSYFSTGTLYPQKESINAVSDGRADFGVVVANSFPGTMNLMGAIDIPGVSPNAVVGSLAAQELVEKFPEVRAEFPKNSLCYFAWTSAAYQIHSLKPINNMDELKGKKIIAWDAVSLEVLKALGANPVRIEGTDSYLALSKAMADGVYCPVAPIRSLKITEACKYHLMVALGTGSFNMFVNKSLWDSMPANIQKWLTDNGGMKMSMAAGKSLEDGQKDDIAWMESQGHVLRYLSDTEKKAFLDKLLPFKDQWVKDCVSRGIKEETARAVLKFVEERIAFHTQELRKGVYGDYKM